MSTICKICVKGTEAKTLESIQEYLSSNDREYIEKESKWPLAIEGSSFQVDSNFPSILSVKAITADVTEVHINSFAKLHDLISFISSVLKTTIVVNHYQSVATASYWAFYKQGNCLREIEAGDGEISAQLGQLLEFESEPLGHNIADENEEAFFNFDDEDQNQYNIKVGIEVEVYQEYNEGWKNLVLESETPEVVINKSWWRFW